jgi:hypothetical protein
MTDSNDDLPGLIGTVALDIHTNRPEGLTGTLPIIREWSSTQRETPDYQIDGDTVRFSSIEARNSVLAAHLFRENQAVHFGEQDWVSLAHDLLVREIGKDSAAGRLLALVHETCDVFKMAASVINRKSMKVFDVLYLVEASLPYLKDLPPDGIWDLCEAQHELTKDDAAAGVLFGNLIETLVGHPDVCRALHGRLRKEISAATANLHPTAILALAKSSPEEAFEFTLEDVKSLDPMLRAPAVRTLGRLIALSLVTPDSIPEAAGAVIENISHPEESVRRTAIWAAAGATHASDVFIESLSDLGAASNPDALAAIAESLSRNLPEMKDKPYFGKWVRFLCKLPSSSTGVIERFDHLLSRLLSDPDHQELAVSCLALWVCNNGSENPRDHYVPELFDITSFELAKRPELLSQVITAWFLNDNRKLPAAAAGLLSRLGISGVESPVFNTSILDTLDERDLLFLARRLVGFIFFEGPLLSLALSLFRTKNASQRVFGILYSLFVEELGYDYPTSTINALELLKSTDADQDLKTFCTAVVEAIKGRMDSLAALPRLVELMPSSSLQRQFRKARARQMDASIENAKKGSLIRQIATEVSIKAGVGSFSFREGVYTDTSYLKSLSHSVVLPRRYLLDSIGYERQLLMLRNVDRNES